MITKFREFLLENNMLNLYIQALNDTEVCTTDDYSDYRWSVAIDVVHWYAASRKFQASESTWADLDGLWRSRCRELANNKIGMSRSDLSKRLLSKKLRTHRILLSGIPLKGLFPTSHNISMKSDFEITSVPTYSVNIQ